MLEEQGLAKAVCEKLHLEKEEQNNNEWEEMIDTIKNLDDKNVNVAIVGKYVELEDSYLSVIESLKHGGFANNTKVNIELVDCEKVTQSTAKEILGKYNGILVPGGFGRRGIEGKIETVRYARENNIPFLGICLGMQMAVVEFARNVSGTSPDGTLVEIVKIPANKFFIAGQFHPEFKSRSDKPAPLFSAFIKSICK